MGTRWKALTLQGRIITGYARCFWKDREWNCMTPNRRMAGFMEKCLWGKNAIMSVYRMALRN